MTSRITPGMQDALNAFANQLEAVATTVARAWYGVEHRRSVLVKRGKTKVIPPVRDERGKMGRVVVYEHPLDAIESELKAYPLEWLEESQAWILDGALMQLDGVALAAKHDAARFAAAQHARTNDWLWQNPWAMDLLGVEAWTPQLIR